MYAVIVGEQGVGKSSLVNRVAKELSLPVWGFFTKKGAAFSKEMGGFPVYLHQVREAPKDGVQEGEFKERVNEGEKHLVAYCNNRLLQVNKEVFDNFAIKLKEPIPEGHLVMMDELGIESSPDIYEKRSDIIQMIKLGSAENMKRFCLGIQAGAPVDSYVTPEPWAMPGYDCDVIMAAGAFIQGSSIELSADGPIREPYMVYMQGGLTFESGKLGIMMAVSAMLDK